MLSDNNVLPQHSGGLSGMGRNRRHTFVLAPRADGSVATMAVYAREEPLPRIAAC